MNLTTFPIAFQLFFTGCKSEPEYDLSKISIENAPTPSEEASPPVKEPPEGDGPNEGPSEDDAPDEGAFEIDDNDCVPPIGQETAFNSTNSVIVSVELGPKVLGHELMIDLIQSEHGELQYGVVCKGTKFSFKAPKMLGTVRAAIFVDADHNGPSADDVQGVTEVFTITDKPVTIPPIAWSEGPITFYNFDGQDVPIDDNPPGR